MQGWAFAHFDDVQFALFSAKMSDPLLSALFLERSAHLLISK